MFATDFPRPHIPRSTRELTPRDVLQHGWVSGSRLLSKEIAENTMQAVHGVEASMERRIGVYNALQNLVRQGRVEVSDNRYSLTQLSDDDLAEQARDNEAVREANEEMEAAERADRVTLTLTTEEAQTLLDALADGQLAAMESGGLNTTKANMVGDLIEKIETITGLEAL